MKAWTSFSLSDGLYFSILVATVVMPFKNEKSYRALYIVSARKMSLADVGGHVMISYQWGSKPIMLLLRDRLLGARYKVWMDVDNMSKSC